MTPERLAEIRRQVCEEAWYQDDTIDDDAKQGLAEELLAEIDRLNAQLKSARERIDNSHDQLVILDPYNSDCDKLRKWLKDNPEAGK